MKKRFNLMFVAFLLCCAASSLLSSPALAQKGGGGGGNSGGTTARHGGNYNINWDPIQPINGHTPKAVGSVGVSTYVAVLDVSVRLSAVYLPDNTELTVTVYSKDF